MEGAASSMSAPDLHVNGHCVVGLRTPLPFPRVSIGTVLAQEARAWPWHAHSLIRIHHTTRRLRASAAEFPFAISGPALYCLVWVSSSLPLLWTARCCCGCAFSVRIPPPRALLRRRVFCVSACSGLWCPLSVEVAALCGVRVDAAGMQVAAGTAAAAGGLSSGWRSWCV